MLKSKTFLLYREKIWGVISLFACSLSKSNTPVINAVHSVFLGPTFWIRERIALPGQLWVE